MSYTIGLRAFYLVFGALPASFLAGMFVNTLVGLRLYEPLLIAWCLASIAGVAGLWLAVLDRLVDFRHYVATTLVLLGLGLVAMSPVLFYLWGFRRAHGLEKWLFALGCLSTVVTALVYIGSRLMKVPGPLESQA